MVTDKLDVTHLHATKTNEWPNISLSAVFVGGFWYVEWEVASRFGKFSIIIIKAPHSTEIPVPFHWRNKNIYKYIQQAHQRAAHSLHIIPVCDTYRIAKRSVEYCVRMVRLTSFTELQSISPFHAASKHALTISEWKCQRHPFACIVSVSIACLFFPLSICAFISRNIHLTCAHLNSLADPVTAYNSCHWARELNKSLERFFPFNVNSSKKKSRISTKNKPSLHTNHYFFKFICSNLKPQWNQFHLTQNLFTILKVTKLF